MRYSVLLIEENPNENIFQKIIPYILSNFSHEIKWSWNQNFLIPKSLDNFSLKNMYKTYDLNVLFKRNWKIITSGEIWGSGPEFWKEAILKIFWKIPKKLSVTEFLHYRCRHTTCNFITKKLQNKWLKNFYSVKYLRCIFNSIKHQ